MAVDDRNTTLIVGAPDEGNGKVYVYSRPAPALNFIQTQVITPFAFGNTLERFGAAVAISPDGSNIIIGSPNASNVKTKYTGEFVAGTDYGKGSVVTKDQQIWKSLVDVEGAEANIQFNSFNSITQVVDELDIETVEASFIQSILIGNYAINPITGLLAFPNQPIAHMLVRAPLAQYDGSGVGNQLKLAWNQTTYSNQDLAALAARSPFNGAFAAIDADFINQTHTIQKKIDVVLYINASTNVPQVGDILQTASALGTVDYVYNSVAEIVIYLKDVNGVFDISDSLFRDDGDFIGQYVKQGPIDSLDSNSQLGGFWYIDTSNYTPTTATTNVDQGRALVVYDVITDTAHTPTYFYNSLDFATATFSSQNTYNAYAPTNELATQTAEKQTNAGQFF